jgi:hypothetical protein
LGWRGRRRLQRLDRHIRQAAQQPANLPGFARCHAKGAMAAPGSGPPRRGGGTIEQRAEHSCDIHGRRLHQTQRPGDGQDGAVAKLQRGHQPEKSVQQT